MNEQLPRTTFDAKTFRRWRLIQVIAVLPLSITVVLMIYFKEAPILFVVSFFLVLVVGVLMPQISADSILSHIVLREELRREVRGLQVEILNLRKELQAATSGRQDPPFKVIK